jgi:opacity protein-like surface antigen
MKKFLLATGFTLVVSLSAIAQDYPQTEVFGGYSFLHSDGRLGSRAPGSTDQHGWNASVTANLNSWFGLTVDFSGHYDSTSSTQDLVPPIIPGFPPLPAFSSTSKSKTNVHSFLVGPTFAYRKTQKITPFGHILLGASRQHVHSEIDNSLFGRSTFTANDTAFTWAVGGGIDVPLGGTLALRVIQADYLQTRAFGGQSDNARLSTGIVFQFGK